NIPNLFKLTINYNDKNNEKPLWVLDGQHRIKALSNSNQKNNPIPFVLLYDLSSNSVYRDSLFAKIFAEVTTGSTPLNYLHQEWLMRAFNLGDYALITHRNSIDTVLHLVSINNLSNLFGDNIEINPDLRDMDRIFDTNLLEMKQLIYNEYYKKISEGGPKKLNSKELALELINAVNILTVLIKAEKNVFFSEKKFRKKIVQQAFLIGCLAFLLKYIQFKQNKYTKTVNWDELFNKYNFSKINWNFNSWVSSLSGSLNTISFKIIKNCFVKMFTEFENHVTVELFNPNFVNFLQGNKAKVKIQLKKKQKSKIISKEELFDVPGVNSCLINDNKYFSISEETPNILIDKITNGDSSPANPKTYSKKKFCIIELNKDGIMHLIITLHLFGGIKKQLVLKLEKFD
ncbi:MAG: hypothetical protein OEZ01_13980, partial [Candidatus Heimdallarchaeota archaeon]|nr:hypothetical protein [Candidatus Heimdallarchaeota archaeon]